MNTTIRSMLTLIVLSCLALSVQAETALTLLSNQSTLQYSAYKYRTMEVKGELKTESLSGFTGVIRGNPESLEDKIEGELILEKPAFDSANARRDEAIDEIFKTKIVVRPVSYTPSTITIELSLNDVVRVEQTEADVFREGDLLRVEGDLKLDRTNYNLVFTEGFAATLDVAVSNEFVVHYDLTFEGNEQANAYIVSLPDAKGKNQEPSPSSPFLKWLKETYQRWFGTS